MSSDNFYVVRKHPKGGYTYVCEFVSDEDKSGDKIYNPPTEDYIQFDTREDAMREALKFDSEYGYQYHWEVYTDEEKLQFIQENAPDDQKNITIEEVDELWRKHDRE